MRRPVTHMRILHIIQCTNLGGMEHAALSITKGLQQRGHPCRWVSLNPLGDLKPLLDEAHVPSLGLPYRGPWGALGLPAMRRAFRAEPRDAVIMTGTNFSAMLALGSRRGEPRILCVHYHHTGVKPRWQWRLIYALARRRFRVITFPSDFVRREAEEIYPPIAAISKTIRTPLCLPPLPSLCEKSAARERLGIPRDVPVIGNAGWLIPRKRFDIFLRVAARVTACLPRALFVVAGDGPDRADLERLARELGVAQKVKWIGWQTDLNDFYCALDVLLFNSDWDAMPTTPVEAIGYGVPVVASLLQGGLREVVEPGSHLFLCSQHDVECLAEKLLFVLAHPEEARNMTMAGRRRLLEVMPVEQLVTTIEGDLGRRG